MTDFANFTLKQYLDELSSEASVPGGGSVSAYTGSLAMGLTQMVARISLKRKKKKDLTVEENQKDDEKRSMITKILESVEKVKVDTFQIVDLDPKVYQEVMDSYSDPTKLEDALNNSFRLQADLALLILMAREANAELAHLVSGSIKNDLLVAAAQYEASYKGAYYTAMINVKYMKDDANKQKAESAMDELQKRFDQGKS